MPPWEIQLSGSGLRKFRNCSNMYCNNRYSMTQQQLLLLQEEEEEAEVA
eukprot:COSAG01_NODE_5978_length_3920_cov_210.481026_5_plen_49_part_00